MGWYSYSCYYCNKVKNIEHKKYETPKVSCDSCKNLMVRSIYNDRNKETTQKRSNT